MAVSASTVAMTGGVSLIATLGLTVIHRTWHFAGVVIDATEDAVVQVVAAAGNAGERVIEEVGSSSARSVPIIFGLIVTLLCLCVHVLVSRFWPSVRDR